MTWPTSKPARTLGYLCALCCLGILMSGCSIEAGALLPADSEPVSAETGIPVPLPNGDTGRFYAATCSDICGDSTVEWEEDGVTYSVGETVGTGGRVLELAWKAIDPTADAPNEPVQCGSDTTRDGDREAAVVTDPTTGLHWLIVCSADATFSTLAPGPGTLSWVEIDGDDSLDLELEYDDRSWLFTVNEKNRVFPLWPQS